MNPAIPDLHPVWCAPDQHRYPDGDDGLATHRSTPRALATAAGATFEITAEQWRHATGEAMPATVALTLPTEQILDLHPVEARRLALLLLAGADLADGSSADWTVTA